jgi:hypothetical protein
MERSMTTEKTYILVEIIQKEPLRKSLAQDLPGRLSRSAYDAIVARGDNCEDVKARIIENPQSGDRVILQTKRYVHYLPGKDIDPKIVLSDNSRA